MSETLKPCPFCGGDLVTRHTGWLDHPKAKCILSGKVFHKGFIGQWNRRADLHPTLSAAMELPEVRALTHAVASQLTYMDMCGDHGDLYNRLKAALAAIKEPKT